VTGFYQGSAEFGSTSLRPGAATRASLPATRLMCAPVGGAMRRNTVRRGVGIAMTPAGRAIVAGYFAGSMTAGGTR